MEKRIRVLMVRVGLEPTVEYIDCTPEAMRLAVGGWLDRVILTGTMNTGGIDLWVDDEGVIKEKPLNRLVLNKLPIVGDFFISRYTWDGDTTSLTEADVQEWMIKVRSWKKYRRFSVVSGGAEGKAGHRA